MVGHTYFVANMKNQMSSVDIAFRRDLLKGAFYLIIFSSKSIAF